MHFTTGLHHITAICSSPKENKQFYTEVLGLYFVKKTINHDDPSTYHLYYGDKHASPGLLMTFFTWTQLPAATRGVGETSRVFFAVPKGSFSFWLQRFREHGVSCKQVTNGFGKQQLLFSDPHGLPLGFEERKAVLSQTSTLDEEVAISGFSSVELTVSSASLSDSSLKLLGYEKTCKKDGLFEYVNAHASFASCVYVREDSSLPRARQGIGSVHHIAFGIDDSKQKLLQEELVRRQLRPSHVVDRIYFHSVYFQEPAGVLFEVATNGPGFYEDEQELGSTFVLPKRYEPYRDEILANLPSLD